MIKHLTKSDLTIIERFWDEKLKQEAICIWKNYVSTFGNKFIDMVPGEQIPIHMMYWGPNNAPLIDKPGAAFAKQSNDWRIQGCSIKGDEDEEARFGTLTANDSIFVFSLFEDSSSWHGRGLFLSNKFSEDKKIIDRLSYFGKKPAKAEDVIDRISGLGLDSAHGIFQVISESIKPYISSDGSAIDSERIDGQGDFFKGSNNTSTRKVILQSQEQLAKRNAETQRIGLEGEKLFDSWLRSKPMINGKSIVSHEWTANDNATSPYDFSVTLEDDSVLLIELKTTKSDFGSEFYISASELQKMSDDSVAIFRVYGFETQDINMKMCLDTKADATSILMQSRIEGGLVLAVQFKVAPQYFKFDSEVISLNDFVV